MKSDNWQGLWRIFLADLATDAKLQETQRLAERLMVAYDNASDRGPDYLLTDEAWNIRAAVEVKSFGNFLTAETPMSVIRDLISRAMESPVVPDLAASIAASPHNAQALDEASSSLRNAGVASNNTGQVFVIVLIWLLAVGLPIALPNLPTSDQTAILGELATVPIAMAITDHPRRDR